MFKYVAFRFGVKITRECNSLDELLDDAHIDLEFNEAWPFEAWEDGTLLWANAKVDPIVD